MKCAIEKAIKDRWLQTKAVTKGANAVLDTLIDRYEKMLEEYPQEQREEIVVSCAELIDNFRKIKIKYNEEMGMD